MGKSRTPHSERVPTNAEAQLPRTIDPLRLLWAVTAGALAIIVAYLHAFPQAANPRQAITPALGLVLLSVSAVLLVARSPWLTARSLTLVLLPCVFFLWAFGRTAMAAVPSMGTPLLGTLLEGTVIFGTAFVVAVIGREWATLSVYESAAGGGVKTRQPDRSDRSDGSDGSDGSNKSEPASAQSPEPFFHCVLVFFLVLAMAMAAWAIYQYFVTYDLQLAQLQNELKAQGRSLADMPAREWALVEALQAKRVGSQFGNPNVLAGFLAMIIPLAIAAAVLWKDRNARAAALAALGVIWYVVLLSGSRGGVLTALVATAGAPILLGRAAIRKHAPVLAIAGGICVAAALLALAAQSRASSRTSGDAAKAVEAPSPFIRRSFTQRLWGSPTIAQRLYYLQSGWDMIRRSPLLGQGLGSYAVLYPEYKKPLAREARFPHNIVCHFWVELGLVGLLLWAAWFGSVLVVAVGALKHAAGAHRRLGITMLLLGALVYALNNLFEMTWVFRETWLDWCLLLGILAGCSVARRDTAGKIEPQAPSPALKPNWKALCVAAAVPLIGVAFGESVLLRPLLAESCQVTANDLRTYGKAGEVEEDILGLALKAIRYQPRNANYYDWLACYYRDRGAAEAARKNTDAANTDFSRAREKFNEALRWNPYSASIRVDFAELERRAGRLDEARRLYREAIEKYPLNARYRQLLADFEKDAGNIEAAREQFDKALQCVLDARESAAIRADYAEMERKNGRSDHARVLLEEACKVFPAVGRYHFLLAEFEKESGNLAAARQHAAEAVPRAADAREKARFIQFLNDLDAKTTAPR